MTNEQRYKNFLKWEAMIQRREARLANKAEKFLNAHFQIVEVK
tara:strand:- start:23490 stop:23618 length:129 start_codon:yes stop_codon:yes gene_type:complete